MKKKNWLLAFLSLCMVGALAGCSLPDGQLPNRDSSSESSSESLSETSSESVSTESSREDSTPEESSSEESSSEDSMPEDSSDEDSTPDEFSSEESSSEESSSEDSSSEDSTPEDSSNEDSTNDSSNEDEHTHTYMETTVPSTCTTQGVTLYFCACGDSYSLALPTMEHEYDNEVAEEQYLKSEATCASPAIYYLSCDCGAKGDDATFEYGGTLPHAFTTGWSYDESHHWHKALCGCDVRDGQAEHISEDGFCSVCGVPTESTEGVLYDLSADGTYAEVIGYEGTATKVKIADTYNGVPVTSIYQEAFFGKSITEVMIPDSVTSIGAHAFYYCSSLTSVVIPDSVTSIGDWAFYWCSSLTSVVIGDSVTSIGRYAFSGCDNLQFNEYGNAKYFGSKDNPYYALISVSNANYSSYTIYESTKVIADFAFSGCARMGSITIPDSVTSIGDWAFYNCRSLTSVVIPDSVTSIGSYAFEYCSSLTSVVIGDSVTSIGDLAFYGCDSLTSVTFEDTTTWYRTNDYDDWLNQTGGTEMDVSDSAKNAERFKNNYYYYWYKL